MTVIRLESDHEHSKVDSMADGSECAQNITPSLKIFEPFAELTGSVLQTITEAADFYSYKQGETIVSHGDYEGSDFFAIFEGALKVTIINPDTGAMFMESVEAGSFFGLDIALSQNTNDVARNITLTAETDIGLWMIDAAVFTQIVGNRPSLAKTLLFFLSSEFLKSRFRTFEFNGAPQQKVCSLLLSYVERDETSGQWHIPNMPKHREIAEAANVKEEDAANAVALLIQEAIVRRNYPGLIIDDMGRLNTLSQ